MLGKRGDNFDKILKFKDFVFEDYFAKPKPEVSESSVARPSSAMSDSDYELVDEHNLPDPGPGPSTESGHQLIGLHAPQSSHVFPTWFHPDHADYKLMGAHASRPNVRPPNPSPSTEFDSDHMPVEEPPSRQVLPTESDAGQKNQVVHPPAPSPIESDVPSNPVSATPNRRSIGANSPLENPQAVSDSLKGNAKESHRISDTARDLLNEREMQRERSL